MGDRIISSRIVAENLKDGYVCYQILNAAALQNFAIPEKDGKKARFAVIATTGALSVKLGAAAVAAAALAGGGQMLIPAGSTGTPIYLGPADSQETTLGVAAIDQAELSIIFYWD